MRLKGVSSAVRSSLGRYNTLHYSFVQCCELVFALMLVENIYASLEPLQPEQEEQAEPGVEEVGQAEVTCQTSTATSVLPGTLIT